MWENRKDSLESRTPRFGVGGLIKGRMELSSTEKGIIGNGEHIL